MFRSIKLNTAPLWSGDLLSPILVKEFFQGLRTRLFTSSFMLLQILLVLAVFLSMIDQNFQRKGNPALFYFFVAIPLIGMLPLSAFNSISEERREKTLELLFLSKLTSFKIVYGKWFSVSLQQLLISTAILPYLILRYFLGGIELWTELKLFGLLVAFSFTFSAVLVLVSSYPIPNAIKWIAVGAAYIGIIVLLIALLNDRYFLEELSNLQHGFSTILFYIILLPFIIFFILNLGCYSLAPDAENNTTRGKGLLLLILLLSFGMSFFLKDHTINLLPLFILIFFSSLVFFIQCLVENTKTAPFIYIPFFKFGKWSRILCPGWAYNISYIFLTTCLVCFTFLAILITQHHESMSDRDWIEFLSGISIFLGCLYCPLFLLNFMHRTFQSPLLGYIVYAFISLVPYGLHYLISMTVAGNIKFITFIICYLTPSSYFCLMLSHSRFDNTDYLIFGAITSLIYIALTQYQALKEKRKLKPVFSQAHSIAQQS